MLLSLNSKLTCFKKSRQITHAPDICSNIFLIGKSYKNLLFELSVGVWDFVIGLSPISSFSLEKQISVTNTHCFINCTEEINFCTLIQLFLR